MSWHTTRVKEPEDVYTYADRYLTGRIEVMRDTYTAERTGWKLTIRRRTGERGNPRATSIHTCNSILANVRAESVEQAEELFEVMKEVYTR